MSEIDYPNPEFKGIFANAEYETALRKTFDRPVAKALRESDPMRQALAFWQAVRESRQRFPDNLEKMRKANIHPQLTEAANAGRTQRYAFNLRTLWLQPFRHHDNPHVRVVAMLECLPTPVFRRWLWHANADFQGYESFLRRVTPEQFESLRIHSDLVWHALRELRFDGKADLPCFQDGWQNRIANGFAKGECRWDPQYPVAPYEDRYVPKAAIAHDFLGWGLGFKRHSDETPESDAANYGSLLLQPLLSKRGEEFSVNTESRGPYWWLYRTLRANRLWGDADEVALRSHVCPGFWATVFAWLFLLVGSPVCAALSVFGTGLPDGMRIALAFPGAVTPLLLAAWGAISLFEAISPQFHRDFVKHLGAIAGTVAVVSVIGFLLVELVLWLDWREPQNWMLTAFVAMWLAHVSSKDEEFIPPWRLPFFGPAFILAIAGRGAYLGYVLYPEEIWRILVLVAMEVLPIVVSLAVVLVLLFGLYLAATLPHALIGKRAHSVLNATLAALREERPQEAYSYAKRSATVWTAALVASLGLMVGLAVLLYGNIDSLAHMEGNKLFVNGWKEGLALLLGSFVLTSAVSAWLGYAGNFLRVLPGRAETVYVTNGSRMGAFHVWEISAMLRNPTFRPSYGVFRFDLANELRMSDNFWICKRWYGEVIASGMIEKFTEESIKRFAEAKTKPYLLPYVGSGLRYGEARKRWREDSVREKAASEQKKALEAIKRQRLNRVKGAFEALLDGFVTGILFIPRMVGAMYRGLMTLKEIFDNACPHVYKPKRMA